MAASNDSPPPNSDQAPDPELEQTLSAPDGERTGTPKLVVEVLSGGRRGLIKECFEEELSLGRRPSNDISFDGKKDRAVSGKHMRLQLREGIWWAEDLSSTNGTLLNGEVLSGARPLGPGDELELGRRPEMGTGGTVKLRVGMDLPATKTSTDDGADPTRLREGDPTATKSDDEGEPASPHSAPEASSNPEPLPASSVRERLATLQTRTLGLGKLTYQLEEQLVLLAQQAMGGQDLDLARLPGGAELLASQATQANWAKECAETRSILDGHGAAAEAELHTLDQRCQERAAGLASSQVAGMQARAKAEEAAQQESSLQAETRATLVPLLADLNRALSDGAFPKDAPLTTWTEALQQAAKVLDSKSDALAANATEAQAAAEQAQASFAAIDAAKAAESEAAAQRQAAARAQTGVLQQLTQRLEQLEAQPEAQAGHAQAQLIAFAARNLQGSPSALAQLPAFGQAGRLEQERAALATEIALIQAELH